MWLYHADIPHEDLIILYFYATKKNKNIERKPKPKLPFFYNRVGEQAQ